MITKIEKVFYTAKTHTTGGREGGSSRTSDGRLDVKLSVPGAPGTNLECPYSKATRSNVGVETNVKTGAVTHVA